MSLKAIIPPSRRPRQRPHRGFAVRAFRPQCAQYAMLQPGEIRQGGSDIMGTCSPNTDGSYDFICDSRGCRGQNGAFAQTPGEICCPQAQNSWQYQRTERTGIPSECCNQDVNSCAKCLTRYQNGPGTAASHFANMQRCKNGCFLQQTAGFGTPETRLLAHNI
jgi:hypothetical protein